VLNRGFDSKTERVDEIMAGRRGGGEDGLSTAETRGAFAAIAGKAADGTGPKIPHGYEDQGAGAGSVGTRTGAAVNPMVQEAREDMVRLKLVEESDVDPMVATRHGLLCKLRDVHTLGVYACDFAADGRHLASCSHDCSVVVWDIEKLQVRRRYAGHTAPVSDVKFIPSGTNERLASSCVDGTVKLWDKRGAKCIFTFDGQLSDPARCLAWSADGKHLACGADDGTVLIWDAETAELCAEDPSITMDAVTDFRLVPQPHFSQGHKGAVRGLSFTIDGKHIVTGGDDGILRLWRVDSRGERVKRTYKGHVGAIQAVSINGDSSMCVSAGSDGTARVWALRTGDCIHVLAGHVGPAYGVSFTKEGNGRRIITGGHDHNVVVWNARTGTVLQSLELLHRSYVVGIACRDDGLLFATASGDRTVGVWRALPQTRLQRCLTMTESAALLCIGFPAMVATFCAGVINGILGDEDADADDERPDLTAPPRPKATAKVTPAPP
jgi:WD40 repeat protein